MVLPQSFQAADRVITPIGRVGTVHLPLWEMPHHVLVQFDSGETYWLLSEILQPASAQPLAQPLAAEEGGMRRAARVDSNQAAITTALRQIGATVQPLHTIGRGCPDLLVGYAGRNFLVEVKDGAKVPSKQRLTSEEAEWHGTWTGQVSVVASVEEAIALLSLNP